MSRESLALDEPEGRDLSALPTYITRPDQPVFRVHRREHSPWWYASDDGGRFNLERPAGTCYLAEDEATAIREVAGESLVRLGVITAEFASVRVISTLHLPGSSRVADLTASAAADAGITREICTCVPYEKPRRWAQAIADGGFAGIRYLARFSTGAADIALAHFGPGGQATHPDDPAPSPLASVAAACGLRVERRPRSVTIAQPPSR